MTAPDVPAATGLRGGVEALVAEARQIAYEPLDNLDRETWVGACLAMAARLREVLDANPEPCIHEWLNRGSMGDEWRECWLCGANEDRPVHPEPTPTGLVDLLVLHKRFPSFARGVDRCGCGWSAVGDPAAHAAHVAAAVLDFLQTSQPTGLGSTEGEANVHQHRKHSDRPGEAPRGADRTRLRRDGGVPDHTGPDPARGLPDLDPVDVSEAAARAELDRVVHDALAARTSDHDWVDEVGAHVAAEVSAWVRGRREAIIEGFLQHVESNGAYNGAPDDGQRFYDWCLNPWLREQAREYRAAAIARTAP